MNFLHLNSTLIEFLECNNLSEASYESHNLNSIRLVDSSEVADINTEVQSLIKENNDKAHTDRFEHSTIEQLELNERVLQEGIISLDLVKEAQLLDNFIQEIVHYKVLPKNYFLRKGILLHKKANIECIVLPHGLICILVHSNHFSFHGRHSPIYKILELIKKVWYHPNLELSLIHI